jgi:hypothetical protein
MKNVMIIDGAVNCAYDIFQMTEEQFKTIFPVEGQDIAFIDEIDEKTLNNINFAEIWRRPVAKKSVDGIAGTLFYQLPQKKEFYPNRKDSDLDFRGRGFSLQDLS